MTVCLLWMTQIGSWVKTFIRYLTSFYSCASFLYFCTVLSFLYTNHASPGDCPEKDTTCYFRPHTSCTMQVTSPSYIFLTYQCKDIYGAKNTLGCASSTCWWCPKNEKCGGKTDRIKKVALVWISFALTVAWISFALTPCSSVEMEKKNPWNQVFCPLLCYRVIYAPVSWWISTTKNELVFKGLPYYHTCHWHTAAMVSAQFDA